MPLKALYWFALGTATMILFFWDRPGSIYDGIPLRFSPMFPGRYPQGLTYKSIHNVGCSKRASD